MIGMPIAQLLLRFTVDDIIASKEAGVAVNSVNEGSALQIVTASRGNESSNEFLKVFHANEQKIDYMDIFNSILKCLVWPDTNYINLLLLDIKLD